MSNRRHDLRGDRPARGKDERLWNAGLPASKLDSGLCLVLAGVLPHRCCPGPGRLADLAPVPTWKGLPTMADKRAKRIAELIRPLRVKPGSKVKLARDFNPGYKADFLTKK
ncbi:MAG TPA: hypothetical protein VEG33_13885, partial [Streptosporangiaceae bacterium]|nr:hypothetical protein [Streptosporangiaceae bacterium]